MPKRRKRRDLVHRWEGNPVITLDDLSFPVADICNAGAIKRNGEYILLVTIQHLEGRYGIHVARSKDGTHFDVADKPLIAPVAKGSESFYEDQGVMDGRITPFEDTYYITYDAVGGHGYRLGLCRTADFQTVERLGLMSEPDTKAGALFPRLIKDKFARLERPWEGQSIWISYSEDLTHWGWSDPVMTPRGGFWDQSRIGSATPPMEIDEGWFFLYYGIKETSAGPLFRMGAAILDLTDPATVIGRTNVPILAPRENYERVGDVPNLVFSCGAIIEPNNEVKVYYGAANSCICVGAAKLDAIVDACMDSSKEY